MQIGIHCSIAAASLQHHCSIMVGPAYVKLMLPSHVAGGYWLQATAPSPHHHRAIPARCWRERARVKSEAYPRRDGCRTKNTTNVRLFVLLSPACTIYYADFWYISRYFRMYHHHHPRSYVDLIFCHRPDPLTPAEVTITAPSLHHHHALNATLTAAIHIMCRP